MNSGAGWVKLIDHVNRIFGITGHKCSVWIYEVGSRLRDSPFTPPSTRASLYCDFHYADSSKHTKVDEDAHSATVSFDGPLRKYYHQSVKSRVRSRMSILLAYDDRSGITLLPCVGR